MVMRLYAVAFIAIGCLLLGGNGIALAGDPASSDDSYSGQSGQPAADPDSMDQPDAADDAGAAQDDEGGAVPDDSGGADDNGAPPPTEEPE